jgi:hypothetical protein
MILTVEKTKKKKIMVVDKVVHFMPLSHIHLCIYVYIYAYMYIYVHISGGK